jgi:hypothetical protein
MWKCHKETPCVAILNKNVFFFSFTKLENRRAEQVLPGRGVGNSVRGRRWGKGMAG